MYRILGSDQKEYGPVSAEVVRQWIAQGRVNAQTQIQAEGTTEWKPLSAFPEFLDAFPTAAPPPVPVATSAAPGGQQTGLATVSLVLGLLSLVTCVLTGIPAIITGHIALSRSKRQPAQFGGAGMATAGLVLGYISLLAVFLLLPALLLPALAKPKVMEKSVVCVTYLKQIGLAAHMYASDHKDVFPPDFQSMSNELNTPKLLVCPSDRSKVVAQTWEQCTSANITYEYLLPGIKVEGSERQEIFRCPIHGNVCFGDGHVEQRGGPGRRTRF